MSRLPRPSRRMILTATLLLLAGAVMNVAVAWGIAAFTSSVNSGQWGFTHQTTYTPQNGSKAHRFNVCRT